MIQPRPEMVEVLVFAAMEGMKEVPGKTGAEVLSACVTMADRAVAAALEQATPEGRRSIRDAVERIWARTADPEERVN